MLWPHSAAVNNRWLEIQSNRRANSCQVPGDCMVFQPFQPCGIKVETAQQWFNKNYQARCGDSIELVFSDAQNSPFSYGKRNTCIFLTGWTMIVLYPCRAKSRRHCFCWEKEILNLLQRRGIVCVNLLMCLRPSKNWRDTSVPSSFFPFLVKSLRSVCCKAICRISGLQFHICACCGRSRYGPAHKSQKSFRNIEKTAAAICTYLDPR